MSMQVGMYWPPHTWHLCRWFWFLWLPNKPSNLKDTLDKSLRDQLGYSFMHGLWQLWLLGSVTYFVQVTSYSEGVSIFTADRLSPISLAFEAVSAKACRSVSMHGSNVYTYYGWLASGHTVGTWPETVYQIPFSTFSVTELFNTVLDVVLSFHSVDCPSTFFFVNDIMPCVRECPRGLVGDHITGRCETCERESASTCTVPVHALNTTLCTKHWLTYSTHCIYVYIHIYIYMRTHAHTCAYIIYHTYTCNTYKHIPTLSDYLVVSWWLNLHWLFCSGYYKYT